MLRLPCHLLKETKTVLVGQFFDSLARSFSLKIWYNKANLLIGGHYGFSKNRLCQYDR